MHELARSLKHMQILYGSLFILGEIMALGPLLATVAHIKLDEARVVDIKGDLVSSRDTNELDEIEADFDFEATLLVANEPDKCAGAEIQLALDVAHTFPTSYL